MKYLYKNISLFRDFGGWQANYRINGIEFALHRCCSRTKGRAMEIAREQVDWLNRRE